MVHRFEMHSGEVRYRSRWVRTPSFLSGKEIVKGLRKGMANTAMVFHAGRLLCLEEGACPWEVLPGSLDTVGPHNFAGRLRHNFTAHPKVCPATGELLFF